MHVKQSKLTKKKYQQIVDSFGYIQEKFTYSRWPKSFSLCFHILLGKLSYIVITWYPCICG